MLWTGPCALASEIPDDAIELPENVIEVIRSPTRQSNCDSQTQAIIFRAAYRIGNDSILFLLGIPDYMCASSNSFVPVVFDPTGQWQFGQPIEGVPFIFHDLERNGGMLLSSQWMIAGTHPELYLSWDGTHWRKILLPEDRNIDCCSELLSQVCVADRTQVHLTFNGDGSISPPFVSWSGTTDQWLVEDFNWIETQDPPPPNANCTSFDPSQSWDLAGKTSPLFLDTKRQDLDEIGKTLYQVRIDDRTLTFVFPRWLH